jgi:hypothetical protein
LYNRLAFLAIANFRFPLLRSNWFYVVPLIQTSALNHSWTLPKPLEQAAAMGGDPLRM